MKDRGQIWINIQTWCARAGRATVGGVKRFWAWLPGTMSLARQHAAQAWALLAQEKLKPVVVVGALSVLPALLFALSRTQDYHTLLARMQDGLMRTMSVASQASLGTILLEWLLRYICAPLMYAILAHLYLGRLRHAPKSVLTTAREKIKGWRSLLYLALVCMIASQLASYLPGLLFSLLHFLVSLVGWVPVLGGVLRFLMSAIVIAATHFLHAALIVALSALWLAQEDLPGQVFPTVVAAWAFLRRHMRSLCGLCIALAIVRWVLVSLMGGYAATLILGELLAALVLPLAASAYTAVLYAETSTHHTGDPFAAPDHIDTIKRAN